MKYEKINNKNNIEAVAMTQQNYNLELKIISFCFI